MGKSAEQISCSLRRMRKLGRALSVVFTVILVLTVLLGVGLTVTVIRLLLEGACVNAHGVISWGDHANVHLVPAALWFFMALLLEITLRGISHDMSRGESPFTTQHARRISILGCAFVLNAFVAVFFRGNVNVNMDLIGFSYWPNPMVLGINVGGGFVLDIGSLLTALVCFSLAAMWRYAALLQSQSDDLV